MKRFIIQAFFSLLIVSFAAMPVNAQRKYEKSFKPGCIPADIKKDGYVLLIKSPFKEKEEKKNAAIQALMESSYTGKFIVIPEGYNGQSLKYSDKNIYRYSIIFSEVGKIKEVMKPNGGIMNVRYSHYKPMIIDALSLNKNNVDPQAINEKLKKEGKKNPTLEDYKKEIDVKDFDLTAMKETGLEDSEKKIDDMLKFILEKIEGK
jgi:hypothetical protein